MIDILIGMIILMMLITLQPRRICVCIYIYVFMEVFP